MKLKNILLIIIILVLFGLLLFTVKFPVLLLEHRESGETVYITKISPGDEFTVRWMHSVELEPWEEIFRIDSNYELVLDRTRFKAFGAGVPAKVGNHSEVSDGWVIYSGINKIVPEVMYGISHYGKHVFLSQDYNLKLYEIIPDGDGLKVSTSTISWFSYLLQLAETKNFNAMN